MFRLCSAKFDGETDGRGGRGVDEANVLKECFETPAPRGIANNKEKHAAKFLPPRFPRFSNFSLSLFLFSSRYECSRYSKHVNAYWKFSSTTNSDDSVRILFLPLASLFIYELTINFRSLIASSIDKYVYIYIYKVK